MDTAEEADICRVCRSEGTPDKPLYHPCVCTGSIKFIHQECLVQWLKHSRKEYCELCKHRFAFTPIYSPDMPSRLPIQDICAGLLTSVGTAIRYWFHYTLVAFAWLGVVPLTACRIYKCLFTGSVSSLLTLPLDMLSTENLLADCLQGCFVVTCTLCASSAWCGSGSRSSTVELRSAVHPLPPPPVRLPLRGREQLMSPLQPSRPPLILQPRTRPSPSPLMFLQTRAAEELTWERMLGLDGSLVFLEHVFWVVSLNTLFILVFAFCPYHIGHFSVVGLGFEEYVSLLVVVEIGVFPLICGWWLDICSLEMFDASLKDRELSFKSAPGTTMFLHWLVGMAGSAVVSEKSERPRLQPVQEMIHLPIYRHLRRFILSVVVFGSIVLLMLWLPIRLIKLLMPTFLPYNVMLYSFLLFFFYLHAVECYFLTLCPSSPLSDAPVSELSLELLLLQVVLPALLEQGHTRQWLKGLVRAWTEDNEGNQPVNNNNNNPPPAHHNNNNNPAPAVGEGLHAAHQAILQQGGPVGFQPYHRPLRFPFRIVLLIAFMCLTLLVASLLYTAACGLYVCWLSIRGVSVLLAWMPQGRTVIARKVQEWTLMILKTLVVALLVAGVIPLLLGLLFELVIVAPLRVPLDQTPLFYPWQDWALGVLHAKIIAAITLMGPQWWLKTVIEQFIIRKLAAPVISVLLLSLCVPYVIAAGGFLLWMEILMQRRIYPFLLMIVSLIGILSFQIRQYLVGQRLVNYERKSGRAASAPPPIPVADSPSRDGKMYYNHGTAEKPPMRVRGSSLI
ncbi:hypothetical protein F7725_028515 [Dissostichus mawsoni]|uniref:E3 ubiquitin-protein ligase MARCHF6 n=1 Tax=Dissostichus mawsoni TaxID=36200 RepID=A0A7J5XH46_DISMA|nr:hypothetical protein F7725_028515 [Dissostichus mawsoni]